ncbi:hypothetical protein CYMTET_18701 [Cymbomonas tetramitiformis]|uniref:Uncharacterized protein n=1 Tax=Cymbomonas tetramitiformis TaxID=36881 RepID=A0AAE0G7H6_9CHLO|nr:hypothetical protein CYMTET_18701 [Cymbomonas tetramitiformis]
MLSIFYVSPYLERPGNLELDDVPMAIAQELSEVKAQIHAHNSGEIPIRPGEGKALAGKAPFGPGLVPPARKLPGITTELLAVLLVPRPGASKRLDLDFWRTNQICVLSKFKVETLKKLRRLARKNDCIFSFALRDGRNMMGIHLRPEGGLDAVFGTALRFGRLPEDLREGGARGVYPSPASLEGRCGTARVAPGKQLAGQPMAWWAGEASEPDMGNFPELCSGEAEALRVREMAAKILHRLGIERDDQNRGLGSDATGGALEARAGPGERTGRGGTVVTFDQAVPPPVYLWTPPCSLGGEIFICGKQRGVSGVCLRAPAPHHVPRLKAITHTFQAFLWELRGRTVLLQCDNKEVVHMPVHFNSRDSALMRHMRRLRLLRDLHNTELAAKYIRSEASEWADRLSRDQDVDDRRLNRRQFDRGSAPWIALPLITPPRKGCHGDCCGTTMATATPWYKEPKALAAARDLLARHPELKPPKATTDWQPSPSCSSVSGKGLLGCTATEEAVLPYMGALLRRGSVAASSMQPYLSAIND